MASTIAAITTGVGGVVTTADASGNLSLLSGVNTVVAVTATGASVTGTLSATGAVTASTTLAVTGAITATAGINAPNTFGFKNRIINGGMVIDQRNAGAAYTPTDGSYTLDRWAAKVTQASKFTVQQVADGPAGFVNSLKVTSSSAYSVLSADWFYVQQIIEGFNSQDLNWGTANASAVTLSFWVKSSLTGTFGGAVFSGSGGNASYPYTYTINSANTWEQKAVVIPAATIGTWLSGNSGNIWITWGLGIGTSNTGAAGSWSGSLVRGANGCVSVVGTNAATFYITGVQLEKGSTATSFDFRDYGRELAMCQRYYQVFAPSFSPMFIGYTGNTDTRGSGSLLQTMRATPTMASTAVWSALIQGNTAVGLNIAVTPTLNAYSTTHWGASVQISSAYGTLVTWTATLSQPITASAEL